MDHFSYLIDREHRFLLIGIVLLVFSVVFALSGETLQRYGGIVSRAEDPRRYWRAVVMYVLGGLFFIVLYLYKKGN